MGGRTREVDFKDLLSGLKGMRGGEKKGRINSQPILTWRERGRGFGVNRGWGKLRKESESYL